MLELRVANRNACTRFVIIIFKMVGYILGSLTIKLFNEIKSF